MGAINVSFDFSTATMRTTKSRYAVKNISRNRPCAMLTCGASVVLTWEMRPGTMMETTAPAHIDATIWVGIKTQVRIHGSLPARLKPKVTCFVGGRGVARQKKN